RPARAALFHTGSGLEITVLLDRCLDIAAASFQGRAMGWRSTTGDVAPHYFEPEGIRWLRSYFGGLVTTCGLTHVGAPRPESALLGNGLHGRIGHTPARNVHVTQEWEGDRYVLSVSGEMRETMVFGENLRLRRTVSTALGEHRFWITDVLTNDGFSPTPFMLLYHCNIGWPALDKGSRILAPARQVAPRDAEAQKGKEHWALMDGPTHGYREKVYYHDMQADKDGMVTVALVNDGFARDAGFGVYVKYAQDTLPRFVQWKQMGEQDYVLGFEPCTCGVEGRQVDEELGLMHVLDPGESRTFRLEFGAITTQKEVDALEKACAKVKPRIVDSYKEFVTKPR
ncbi:MAG: aldose 1-epimerase family protein, partial [Candidatus Hydrogenedentes bacterium]|nr:aldose 1-epimerase family protein [Candidatus Hydrogenedentota bacterium]